MPRSTGMYESGLQEFSPRLALAGGFFRPIAVAVVQRRIAPPETFSVDVAVVFDALIGIRRVHARTNRVDDEFILGFDA